MTKFIAVVALDPGMQSLIVDTVNDNEHVAVPIDLKHIYDRGDEFVGPAEFDAAILSLPYVPFVAVNGVFMRYNVAVFQSEGENQREVVNEVKRFRENGFPSEGFVMYHNV